jgi:hypothetical protein
MRIALTMLLVTLCFGALAQHWQVDVETGGDWFGLPRSDYYAGGRERFIPKLNPLVGIHLQGHTKIGFYVDAMTRFNSIGNRSTYHRDGTNKLRGTPYTTDQEKTFSATKFAYGGGLGYRFGVWKKTFNVIAGYRKAYFISGRYSYDYSHHSDAAPIEIHKSYDPFSEPSLDIQAKRKGREFFAAAGMDVTPRFNVSFQFSFGANFLFTEPAPIEHNSLTYHPYSASNYCLSVNYRLASTKRNLTPQ